MDKIINFSGRTEQGVFAYVLGKETPYLEKTAAEYHPQIAEFIRNAKSVPGRTQILLTALGSGEYYGANVNGDYFPEAALAHEGDDYGYQTFKKFAKVYKHHINKDPLKSYGDVLVGVYNNSYKRVELIISIDNEKCPEEVAKINSGEPIDFSMGCRVPWDECSICGNRAPTVKDYCEHLKYYMNRIHPPTGKQAYAINRLPRFFDISIVLIGADRIAKSLLKVASVGTNKVATIEKEIPVEGAPSSQDAIESIVRAIPEVKAREKTIPHSTLDSLARQFTLQEIVSTLAFMGIILKPQEFQRVFLLKAGKQDIADTLDAKNICFDPDSEPQPEHEKILGLSSNNFNSTIMDRMQHFVADRSYMAPHLARRIIIIEKTAEHNIPKFPIFFDADKHDLDARYKLGILPIMLLASGLYAAMAKKSPGVVTSEIGKVIAKNPGLAAALASAVPMIFNSVAGEGGRGNYVENLEPEIDNIGQKLQERRERPFAKLGASNIGASMSRMFMGVPAVYMASGMLQKHKNYNPEQNESKITRFIRRNPDILGAAVAVDSLMALSGKGTHGMWNKVQPLAQKLFKTASMRDFVENAAIAPLAFGGKGLASRMVGGLFDQAIVEGSKKILSKKKSNAMINDNGGNYGNIE